MPISPLFAGIFAIIYVYLSLRVAFLRKSKKIVLGTGEDKDLEKAIRIQANFGEYVPISLILMWFLEIIAHASDLVVILGCVLLVARLAHIVGIKDPRNKLIFRQLGMIGTFGVILSLSAVLIWHYLPVTI